MKLIIKTFRYTVRCRKKENDVGSATLGCIGKFVTIDLFSVLPIGLCSLDISLRDSFKSTLSNVASTRDVKVATRRILVSTTVPKIKGPVLRVFYTIVVKCTIVGIFFKGLGEKNVLLVRVTIKDLCVFSIPEKCVSNFAR